MIRTLREHKIRVTLTQAQNKPTVRWILNIPKSFCLFHSRNLLKYLLYISWLLEAMNYNFYLSKFFTDVSTYESTNNT